MPLFFSVLNGLGLCLSQGSTVIWTKCVDVRILCEESQKSTDGNKDLKAILNVLGLS